MSDVDILYDAIIKQKPMVSLQTVRPFQNLLEAVYKREPRLTGWLSGYEGKKSGSLIRTLELSLTYREGIAQNINDVILDDKATWRPSSELREPKNPPRLFHIVTKDAEAFERRMEEENDTLSVICPGYAGYSWQMQEKPSANGYSYALVELKYIYDQPTYEMYWVQAERKMESICHRFFGNEKVHKLVKTFLAFSYIQQHCEYDDQAYECIKRNELDKIQRPWVVLPFGPIERNMGICCGIAYAMQMFLNYFKIPNRIINGEIKDGDDVKAHAWNLVEFNGKYYHIDATTGVSGSEVYIGTFMKNDKEMQQTHTWDAAKFPAAEGTRFNYDFIEEYIEEHETEILDAGVEENYLFPADITE